MLVQTNVRGQDLKTYLINMRVAQKEKEAFQKDLIWIQANIIRIKLIPEKIIIITRIHIPKGISGVGVEAKVITGVKVSGNSGIGTIMMILAASMIREEEEDIGTKDMIGEGVSHITGTGGVLITEVGIQDILIEVEGEDIMIFMKVIVNLKHIELTHTTEMQTLEEQ